MSRKKKPEDPPKGSPAWMATFSDLMNLLLCFFVLLFSMSSVDQGKAEALVKSLANTFSVFSGGGSSFGDGNMISNGTSQLTQLDNYFNSMGKTEDGDSIANEVTGDSSGSEEQEIGPHTSPIPTLDPLLSPTPTPTPGQGEEVGLTPTPSPTPGQGEESALTPTPTPTPGGGEEGKPTPTPVAPTLTPTPTKTPQEIIEEMNKGYSTIIYDEVMDMVTKYNLGQYLDIGIDSENYHYITIEIKGAILFDSGKAELKKDAKPLISNVADMLKQYEGCRIEVIGHTDNVPQTKPPYESNEHLSAARAISVAKYLAEDKNIGWENIHYSGRGEHEPIASNDTKEGRDKNRRVEIRLYNQMSSN